MVVELLPKPVMFDVRPFVVVVFEFDVNVALLFVVSLDEGL